MRIHETGRLWIAVLIKDFSTAKTRLHTLSADERSTIARECARRALRAALSVAPTVAICGSGDAAALATSVGAEAITEGRPSGQNAAARCGVEAAVARGAATVLLLSSDLPLVDEHAVRGLVDGVNDVIGPTAIAAAALGREGTNALLLRPPHKFELHFGQASLPRFAAEATSRGRTFLVHDDVRLALDIDEPDDLLTLQRVQGAA